ncbi:hypothetical protein FACS189490_00710 [Clostridia bacterium]|nr:hypothetical protein FACS189490_00710 [Clostridia bacterium]
MIDKILETLNQNNIENYLLLEKTTTSAELFFVRRRLDISRGTKIKTYTLTVYHDVEKDGEKRRGSYLAYIHAGFSDAEIESVVKSAYTSAVYAANEYYPLPKGEKETPITIESSLNGLSLSDIAVKMSEALFAADSLEDAYVNSAEIFAIHSDVRLINSAGIDVGYSNRTVKGEFVTTCERGQNVEYYQQFEYDGLQTQQLTALAAQSLQIARDRSVAAVSPKSGNYDVILSGEQIHELLQIYDRRAWGGMIFPKYSDYKIGDSVQDGDIAGEKLNINLKANVPYGEEGIRLIDRELVKDGVLTAITANARWGHLLGVEPTGVYSKLELQNGTVSLADMKKSPHLHIISFSDFQMDPMSGHFGGEIRLGYLFDGEKTTIVTGGSINGLIFEAHKDLAFSTERYADSKYDGPFAVRLKNVAVAGV